MSRAAKRGAIREHHRRATITVQCIATAFQLTWINDAIYSKRMLRISDIWLKRKACVALLAGSTKRSYLTKGSI